MLRSSIRITSVPLVLLRERHLSTISYRPVDPHNVDSSYLQYFGNSFIFFLFVIPSASRSDRDLSLFSFSFAPYPVLRSLRLSLTGWYRDHSLFTCLVLFPFPLGWPRAISHRSSSYIHENQSSFVRYRAIVAHDFPSWFFSRSMTPFV